MARAQSIWPWAEANAGLLSLIALVLALALALFEHKRADDAWKARFNEYVVLVYGLTIETAAYLSPIVNGLAADVRAQRNLLAEWETARVAALEALATARPAAPPDPFLQLAVDRLIKAMSEDISAPDHAESIRSMTQEWLARMLSARGDVEKRRR